MSVALKVLITLVWGWVSRMCGGAPPKLPWGLDQWLYALPYLVVCLPSWWSIAAYLGAVLGKRMGHGRGMSLREPMKPGSKPEKIEFLILWLQPHLPVYWYKVLILALTGLAVSLVAGIVTHNPVLALSGLLKAPGYMIGWAIYPSGKGRGIPYLNEATAIGEALGLLSIGVVVYYWQL